MRLSRVSAGMMLLAGLACGGGGDDGPPTPPPPAQNQDPKVAGRGGPRGDPKCEVTLEALKIRPCVVKVNYCGTGIPGKLDMQPEEKKWRCFLCPVKFLRADQLHRHVPRFHPRFHQDFVRGRYLYFRKCEYCCELFMITPLLPSLVPCRLPIFFSYSNQYPLIVLCV